jgi:all-trans-retinol 13,14-reductase
MGAVVSFLFRMALYSALLLIGCAACAIYVHIVYVQPIFSKAKALAGKKHIVGRFRNECDAAITKSYDAIVIGSGISGLMTAALLSRRGKKILVLEKHDCLGGTTHEFTEKGYRFDTGLHYVGNKVGDRKSFMGYLFSLLTVDELRWCKMNTHYDEAAVTPNLMGSSPGEPSKAHEHEAGYNESNVSREAFRFSSEPGAIAKDLSGRFPEEKDNIQRYFKMIKWGEVVFGIYVALKIIPASISAMIRKRLKFVDSFLSASTEDVMDMCIGDPQLKGVLGWCWGDYGMPLHKSPFLMHSVLTSHWEGGAYYPAHGPGRIATNILHTIRAAGGEAFVRSPVTNILLSDDKRRAIGVRVDGCDVYAPLVVSSAGLMNTYTRFIPTKARCPVADDVRSRIIYPTPSAPSIAATSASKEQTASKVPKNEEEMRLSPSCSMFSVFVGLRGSPNDLDLKPQNYWYFPKWDHVDSWSRYEKSIADVISELKKMTAEVKGDKWNDFVDDARISALMDRIYLPLLFISSSTAKDHKSEFHIGDAVRTDSADEAGTSVELLTVADFDLFASLDGLAGSNMPDNDNDDDHNGNGNGDEHTYSSISPVVPPKRKSAYLVAKAALEARMVSIFKNEFPQLADKIDHVSSGTPLTNNQYLNSVRGEVYGLGHSVKRFSPDLDADLRPTQRISGLYLTGQDILCDGICGAAASAVMTSVTIDWMVAVDLMTTYVLHYL